MSKAIYEYIWLDGNQPNQTLRSKIKILPKGRALDELPIWNFDGSSTNQANGNSSDCLLKPVRLYPQPSDENSFYVMCEVLNPDETPHESNNRHHLIDDTDMWFGFEQEYVIMKNNKPLGFPLDGYPEPQGNYYCGVGANHIQGRDFVNEHMKQCIDIGLDITGVNAEVLLGQWEYQIMGKDTKKAADDLWMSRYLLIKLAEKYDYSIEFHPKPIRGDWNGSGMHANFSNKEMREVGGEALFRSICETFRTTHSHHIENYGAYNNERLTGKHETQHIGQFSYGVSDRGASIRIPVNVVNNGWKGYLEDRRPASNADPYVITRLIASTLESVVINDELLVMHEEV